VTLLGNLEAGTGTFGRIEPGGRITWFRLSSPQVARAGLLHIAFDPPGAPPAAWLLSSTVTSPNMPDAVIRVVFDAKLTKIVSESVAALPTQQCKAHRLLPVRDGVLVTELTSATVARLDTPRGVARQRPVTLKPADPA